MKSPCSAYLCARVLLGSLDLASDLLVCVHLVLERQLAWAALIGLFILTGTTQILATSESPQFVS